MSFNYNKSKHTHSSDSFWTSYSDLFLGLSTIFLLLYVMASLRTGTDAIRAQIDNQKLTMENDELKAQLKMYENVKTDYMERASRDETQEYQELMDKLTLLKEDAKNDQERLARESLENEHKAGALNKYQQMIRNVINANKVAKTKLLARNGFIKEQDQTIDEQKSDINSLEADVQQKKDQIERGEQQIAATQAALSKNKQQLLKAYKAHQISKKMFEAKMHSVQQASDQKVHKLMAQNKEVEAQLSQSESEKAGLQSSLSQAEHDKAGLKSSLNRAENEKAGLKSSLNQAENEKVGLQSSLAQAEGEKANLRGQINGIRQAYAKERASERAAFDAEMKKGKMDAAERARREGEFRNAAAAKEREMQNKISGLQGQLRDTSGALAKAKEEMDTRRDIAREIAKGFAAAGVKADINMQTGEVVLDFGDHYFDSDSAALKTEMKSIIERAMPVYSKSLFGNEKVASKISAVEIIGFASPTYQGRFVDPHSSKPEDKAALKYNMDLSYRRANSIFNYLLEGKHDFDHQKNLMALMKVSGRSFLEVMKTAPRGPASASEFCRFNDCKKAQRVIVRFSMDGKK